jgi:DNA-binding NtrC family response regulator
MPRTLLVDDEPDILMVLERVFARFGHTVTTAGSGNVALKLLQEHPFDLLVTDKNLPEVDGVTLASTARAGNPRMGIILVTGYASLESAQELLGVADAYFLKPFSLQGLRQTLDSVLERRGALGRAVNAGDRPVRSVLLIEPDPRERERLAKLLLDLGLGVTAGASVEELLRPLDIEALVISTRALAPELNPLVWRLQGKDPSFRVVAVSPYSSVDDSVKAIGVAASAHLYTSDGDAALTGKLREALQLGRVSPPRAA